MILETVSRQLGSSLRTWLRKPQMVVTGLNSRSRSWTPYSWRASRMLGSLRESAKGSPWSRAKRARTSSRVVMGVSNVWGGRGAESGSAAAGPVRTPDKGRTSRQPLLPSLYAAPPDNTLRLQLQQGPALATKLATFVDETDARRAVASVGPTSGQSRRLRRNSTMLRHPI